MTMKIANFRKQNEKIKITLKMGTFSKFKDDLKIWITLLYEDNLQEERQLKKIRTI